MDEFARAVINSEESKVPGEMSREDVAVLMAIYQAAEIGKSVPLNF